MSILREEFRQFINVPKNLVFLVLGPMFFTLFFGFVYYNDYLNDITVGVLDQDHSATSRMILRTFDDSDRFIVTETPSDQQAFKTLMTEKKIHLGVFIPPGFEKDIRRGRDTGALLLVDGANIAIGNNALATAGEILNTLSAGVTIKVLEGRNASPESAEGLARIFQFQGRTLYDTKLSYKYYIMPGLLMVLVQQLFLAVFVPNFVEDPRHPLHKGAVHIGAAVLSYGLCLAVLQGIIGIRFSGSPLLAVLLMAFYLTCLMGTAMSLAALLRTRLLATQVCMMLSMPTFLLAGYVWPMAQMPALLTGIVQGIWPLIHILAPVRDILIKGTPVTLFLGNILALAAFGGIWFLIGSRLVKQRLLSERTEEVETGSMHGAEARA